ncbi:MAG TPA: hypothetical protein VFU37_05770, partial [Pyrinomonadaceae bacterium]|nr:hypothetical protein [Pyrinomonadaceae bacterium]
TLATAVIDALEQATPENQPYVPFEMAFVSDQGPIRIVVSNETSADSVIKIAPIGLYDLGPARFLWTRYPRFVIRAVQRLFVTAVMLPLAIIGLLILIFQKQSKALVVLSVVPVYFFLVQSIVHTEYRYVLAVDHSMFVLVAVTVAGVASFIRNHLTLGTRRQHKAGH